MTPTIRAQLQVHEIEARYRADVRISLAVVSWADLRTIEHEYAEQARILTRTQSGEYTDGRLRYRPNRWLPQGRVVLLDEKGEIVGVLDLMQEEEPRDQLEREVIQLRAQLRESEARVERLTQVALDYLAGEASRQPISFFFQQTDKEWRQRNHGEFPARSPEP